MRLKIRIGAAHTVVAAASVSGLVTGLVATGGVTPAGAEEQPWTIPTMQYAPVPVAQSGEIVIWGDGEFGRLDVPAAVRSVAVSQVVAASGALLALTASGKVVGWGNTLGMVETPPASLASKRVTQLAIAPARYAGAVTQDGQVVVWGLAASGENPTTVPERATNVVQLALTNQNAVAVRSDHTVVAWGARADINKVPKPLDANEDPQPLLAKEVVTTASAAYALTTTGTVVAWGDPAGADSPQLLLPHEVTIPGNVVSISAAGQGGIAQLQDGSFVGWGLNYRSRCCGTAGPVLPSTLTADDIVAFDGSGDQNGPILALDADGVLHQWAANASPTEIGGIPAALTGAPIVQFSAGTGTNGVALVTKMLPVAAPVVAGTPRVGATLTATPSVFSGTPDSVTGQWHVNGVATGNTSTTLPLTAALVGKTVAYVSTAVKEGASASTSSSVPVKVAPALVPAKVASVTKVTTVKAAKKGVKVTVAGKVTASKAPTGIAVVTIAKGKKKVVTKTIRIPANGKVSLTVTKFNKLALKAIKGKSKTRYRGKYTLVISYAGNSAVKPSRTQKTFTVK